MDCNLSVTVTVGFLWVVQFPPTVQNKHASGDSKLAEGS